jgi:hypothetical protein
MAVAKERQMEGHPPALQAIQTFYDGQHYRSRLEARWAVFFNAMRIHYQYEPEGFNLHGTFYLPDFYLPTQKYFFEVKGPFTDNNGEEKAIRLANASDQVVYLFGEIPKIDKQITGSGLAFYPGGIMDAGYLWCMKKCCGKVGIQYHGRSGRIECDCHDRDTTDRESTYDHGSILMAYAAARCHRFERSGA